MGLGSKIALIVAPIVAAKLMDFVIEIYNNTQNDDKIEHTAKEKPK